MPGSHYEDYVGSREVNQGDIDRFNAARQRASQEAEEPTLSGLEEARATLERIDREKEEAILAIPEIERTPEQWRELRELTQKRLRRVHPSQ